MHRCSRGGENTCLRICNIVIVIIDLNVLGFVEMYIYVYVIVVVQQRVRSCKLTLIEDYSCESQIDPS